MNIILFTESELTQGIEANDRRVSHVREVLSIPDGERFDAGVINGMRGKAQFNSDSGSEIGAGLVWQWFSNQPNRRPIFTQSML